jgi:RNA polymerase sigma-70 factor (ECF subfamily)
MDRRSKMAWIGREQASATVSPPERAVDTDFATTTLVHAAALYRTAYHLTGNAAEAEDLTQETFLRAYRGFAGFRGGDMRAWLFTILRHAFLDECRRRQRMPVTESVDDDALAVSTPDSHTWSPSAESEALRCLPSEAIDRAFATLPPDWRLVVLLADVEELSYREIADVLAIPIGTVMSRLYRARKRLQDQLSSSRLHGRKPHERSA